MNFTTIMVIARKEFRDVLRDRRTLVFMMLLPIVVMPLIMLGMAKFMTQQQEAKQARVVRVAADAMTIATLRSLRGDWYEQNAKPLALLAGRMGLAAAGGLEALPSLLARVDELETARDSADGERPEVDGATIAAALKALEDLDEGQRRLLQEARDVGGLLERLEFIDPGSLSDDGALAQGVAIPEDVPAALAAERFTLAIQGKQIEAAIFLPADALATLAESPLSVPFLQLHDPRSGLDYAPDEYSLLSRSPGLASVPLHVLYDSSQGLSKEAHDRLEAFALGISRFTRDLRLGQAELPTDFAEPVVLREANVATNSRRLQALLGGLLPYLIFAFCFFGALYPALDVTAGEKERFTLETLLLAPVSRLEIAVGKFLVVFVAAIVAALLTTTSMVVTLTHGILPAEVMSSLDIEFQPLALILTGSLIIPVAALYASALLAVGLYARSFKEAQSYTVPLQFLFVLPTMVSLIPDVEAEGHLAWIPFVNISILMRELLKGNYLWSFYSITLASTVMLTLAALLLAAWLFRRESVLLRS